MYHTFVALLYEVFQKRITTFYTKRSANSSLPVNGCTIEMFHTGRIVRKSLASPTVVVLDLDVPGFSFRPGQWVDFVVPPHEWVGGFSLASSPRDVPLVRLAVKRSDHPPALWVHDRSRVHDAVRLSVGGSCVLDPRSTHRPAVFCAGGIGISPILSQYREFLYQRERLPGSGSGAAADNPATSLFLYSVSSPDELVFAEELADLSRPGSISGRDRMIFALTKSTSTTWDDSLENSKDDATHVERKMGRRLIEILDAAPKDAIYYICGPPSMIDDAVSHLTQKGVPSDSIKLEKWW